MVILYGSSIEAAAAEFDRIRSAVDKAFSWGSGQENTPNAMSPMMARNSLKFSTGLLPELLGAVTSPKILEMKYEDHFEFVEEVKRCICLGQNGGKWGEYEGNARLMKLLSKYDLLSTLPERHAYDYDHFSENAARNRSILEKMLLWSQSWDHGRGHEQWNTLCSAIYMSWSHLLDTKETSRPPIQTKNWKIVYGRGQTSPQIPPLGNSSTVAVAQNIGERAQGQRSQWSEHRPPSEHSDWSKSTENSGWGKGSERSETEKFPVIALARSGP
ncbi:hypothetical protein TWF694_011048 [Orbilia ellipsospora]|uniref:Uncharacterized protein n=1 Tax=Orbilia ellipsospora TaxID=2528407 RepID=A0AAV9X942_9PEZI